MKAVAVPMRCCSSGLKRQILSGQFYFHLQYLDVLGSEILFESCFMFLVLVCKPLCVYALPNVQRSSLLLYIPRSKSNVYGGSWPRNKKQTRCGVKWGCDCRVLNPNLDLATQHWNLKDEPWKWTVELLIFAELIAHCDGHAEIWRRGATEDLCSEISFQRPWSYSFSHALNDPRSGQFTPQHLIKQGLSYWAIRESCVFTTISKNISHLVQFVSPFIFRDVLCDCNDHDVINWPLHN